MVQEIDTAPGVYPVVWSVKREPRRHRQGPGASGDPPRAPPGNAKDQSEAGGTGRLRSTQVVQDFIRDEEHQEKRTCLGSALETRERFELARQPPLYLAWRGRS